INDSRPDTFAKLVRRIPAPQDSCEAAAAFDNCREAGSPRSRGSIWQRRPRVMNEFLQRLRERKLVQWALAYAAGAFALLQGLDIVAQQFGWPESVRRGITIALLIGFFVTLILAWYHGEQGAQRVSGTELS